MCEAIDTDIIPTELWNTVRKFRGEHSSNRKVISESCLNDVYDLLYGLIDPINSPLSVVTCPNENGFFMDEWNAAITSPKDTSAGLDGIRQGHTKNFSNDVMVRLG